MINNLPKIARRQRNYQELCLKLMYCLDKTKEQIISSSRRYLGDFYSFYDYVMATGKLP